MFEAEVLVGWIAVNVVRSNNQESIALEILRTKEYLIMSDLWVPVIAALGASALTGIVAFGLEWWRSYRADKSARAEQRSRAYTSSFAEVVRASYTGTGQATAGARVSPVDHIQSEEKTFEGGVAVGWVL